MAFDVPCFIHWRGGKYPPWINLEGAQLVGVPQKDLQLKAYTNQVPWNLGYCQLVPPFTEVQEVQSVCETRVSFSEKWYWLPCMGHSFECFLSFFVHLARSEEVGNRQSKKLACSPQTKSKQILSSWLMVFCGLLLSNLNNIYKIFSFKANCYLHVDFKYLAAITYIHEWTSYWLHFLLAVQSVVLDGGVFKSYS